MPRPRDLKLRKITDAEQDRMREIQFYIFVQKLLEANNMSALALDLLDSLGNAFNCNTVILRKLALNIYQQQGIIKPTKKEIALMYYRTGTSTLRIRELLQIHPQTLYRYIQEYIDEGQFEYVYKTDEEELVTIKRFMVQLERLVNWR